MPYLKGFKIQKRVNCHLCKLQLIREVILRIQIFTSIIEFLFLQTKNRYNTKQFFIMKHNQVVQNIVNHIISRSRRTSFESLQTKTKHTKNINRKYEQDDNLQEYIIQKGDLRQIIQKLANEHISKEIMIEKLNQEITDLKMEIIKQKQLKIAVDDNNSKDGFSVYKENLLNQYISDLSTERKISEQLAKDHQWMGERFKAQLKEMEELKQNLAKKEDIIQKLNAKDRNNGKLADERNRYKKANPNQQYFTPKKENSKKGPPPILSIDSMEQTLFTDTLTRPTDFCNPTIKHFQTQATKQNQRELSASVLKINLQNDFRGGLTQSQLSMNGDKVKLQLQIDKKNRALKLLGIKCTNLQLYIQKLTNRFLGERIISLHCKKQQLSETKVNQNVLSIQQIEQQEKISEIDSYWDESGTFKVSTSEI